MQGASAEADRDESLAATRGLPLPVAALLGKSEPSDRSPAPMSADQRLAPRQPRKNHFPKRQVQVLRYSGPHATTQERPHQTHAREPAIGPRQPRKNRFPEETSAGSPVLRPPRNHAKRSHQLRPSPKARRLLFGIEPTKGPRNRGWFGWGRDPAAR